MVERLVGSVGCLGRKISKKMRISMTGCMALSLAGHDRNQIYLIVGEEKEYVYLADGKTRTCTQPKKKNKKHIQIIKKYKNPVVEEKLLRGESVDAGIIIQEVKACQKQM